MQLPGYEPNSYGEWQEQPDFAEPPLDLNGAAGRWKPSVDDDYYSQPRELFRPMSPAQQQVLFENAARDCSVTVTEAIRIRHKESIA